MVSKTHSSVELWVLFLFCYQFFTGFFHWNFFDNFDFIDSLWFKITVASHTSTSWDDLTDNDILFETEKVIFLTTDSCIRQDTSCFLEGSC